MEWSQVEEKIIEEYMKNGYIHNWMIEYHRQPNELQKYLDLCEIGLIHTEVAEAQEAIRKDDYNELRIECADIIIRTINFARRMGWDMEKAILEKTEKNMHRGYLHGKKI